MSFIDDVASGFGIGGGEVTTPEFSMVPGSYGVGSVRYDPNEGLLSSLDPKYQALVDEVISKRQLSPEQLALGTQATQTGAGFLSALQETDPFALAEEQFNRLEQILQPGRQREEAALESRLLRQGRLGSTGGARTQGAFREAVEQSRRKNLYDAFASAQNVQKQQADIAKDMGAFGLTTEQENLQRILSALSGATATEAMPITTLGPMQEWMSGAKSEADAARAKEAASGGSFGELLGSAGRAYLSAYTGGMV